MNSKILEKYLGSILADVTMAAGVLQFYKISQFIKPDSQGGTNRFKAPHYVFCTGIIRILGYPQDLTKVNEQVIKHFCQAFEVEQQVIDKEILYQIAGRV